MGTKGFSRKTSTVLLLNPDKEFAAFGYEAEEQYSQLAAEEMHKDWYYFEKFKMKLHGEKVMYEIFLFHISLKGFLKLSL